MLDKFSVVIDQTIERREGLETGLETEVNFVDKSTALPLSDLYLLPPTRVDQRNG